MIRIKWREVHGALLRTLGLSLSSKDMAMITGGLSPNLLVIIKYLLFLSFFVSDIYGCYDYSMNQLFLYFFVFYRIVSVGFGTLLLHITRGNCSAETNTCWWSKCIKNDMIEVQSYHMEPNDIYELIAILFLVYFGVHLNQLIIYQSKEHISFEDVWLNLIIPLPT